MTSPWGKRRRGPRERMFDRPVCQKRSFKAGKSGAEEGGEPHSSRTTPALWGFGTFVPLHREWRWYRRSRHTDYKAINQNLNSVLRDSNINGHDYMRNIVHLPVFLNSRGLSSAKKLCMVTPTNGEAMPAEGKDTGLWTTTTYIACTCIEVLRKRKQMWLYGACHFIFPIVLWLRCTVLIFKLGQLSLFSSHLFLKDGTMIRTGRCLWQAWVKTRPSLAARPP